MITGKEGLTEAIVEAFVMEKGTREFYAFAAEKVGMGPAKEVLLRLHDWEDAHMKYLESLYQALLGEREFESYEAFSSHVPATHIESGIPLKEAEQLFERKPELNERDAVEIALGIEGKAYNLYRKLSERAEDRNARVVFAEMKNQEQQHIDFLMDLKRSLGS